MIEKHKPRPKKKQSFRMVFGIVLIATALIVSFSLTLADSYKPALPFGEKISPAPPANVATPATQCKLDIAYAYVGPAPSNSSYQTQKGTMYLIAQYPSVVRLNATRLPGIQLKDCDAEIEVYGVKIASDTGATEYHAYFIGTNYNPAFTSDNQSTLCSIYVDYLIDPAIYATATGTFVRNWTLDMHAPASVMSNTIGSIMSYGSYRGGNHTGLYSLGKPNYITVTVYRIGYITMSNGSVSLFKDPVNGAGVNALTDKVVATVQLGNYENGFLHNDIVPMAELPQIDIFHPTAGP